MSQHSQRSKFRPYNTEMIFVFLAMLFLLSVPLFLSRLFLRRLIKCFLQNAPLLCSTRLESRNARPKSYCKKKKRKDLGTKNIPNMCQRLPEVGKSALTKWRLLFGTPDWLTRLYVSSDWFIKPVARADLIMEFNTEVHCKANHRSFWIPVCLRKTRSEKSHDYSDAAPCSKCFPSTREWKAGVFKLLRFKERFRKAPFSWQILSCVFKFLRQQPKPRLIVNLFIYLFI